MSLELLSDELLLFICSYLSPIDILQAFNNLNTRFNSTISDYRKQINLSQVTYEQFLQYCDILSQTNLGLEVRSFILSISEPVLGQLSLLSKYVYSLDQKLPNLECLTLCGITDDQLNLFLPNIMCFEKLTELNVNYQYDSFYSSSVSIIFHRLTKSMSSLRKLSIQDTPFSLGSIFDWDNNTITHLTITLDTTNDLIIILHHFHRLHFLDVTIGKFETPDADCSFNTISPPQLKEFHFTTLNTPNLQTLKELTTLLMNMSSLKHVQYDLRLGTIRMIENTVTYLKDPNWQTIHEQLEHFVNCNCTISCELRWKNQNDEECLQIPACLSAFPNYSVGACEVRWDTIYVYAYTKNRPLYEISLRQNGLDKLNGSEVTTLIDNASLLDINADYYDDNTPTEFPILVLPDQNFPKLHSISVSADDYMFFNELLKSFLKQLFHRSPNLRSIEISNTGDRTGYDGIWNVLNCMEKPLLSIKSCRLNVKSDFDQRLFEKLSFYLPMLTSLSILNIDGIENFLASINTCANYNFKHLIHLELGIPTSFAAVTISDLNNHKKRKNDIQLWLKENTLLGSSTLRKTFYAKLDKYLYIWF